MRALVERLSNSVRRRSTGSVGKRRAYRLQYLSAVVFAAVALALGDAATLLALVFALEALGQCLLASDGARTAHRGDDEVVYFRRNVLGAGAVLVFAMQSFTRFALADAVLETGGQLAVVGGLGCATAALMVLSTRVRADLVIGGTIALSAVLLGSSLAIAGYPGAAVAQFAYASVLAVGVLALQPWRAELVNIPVFASAALWPPPC